MRLIFRTELQKVWRRRGMWFFLLILIFGYTFYLIGEINGKTGQDQYSYHAYKQLADSIDTEHLQEEIARLERQREDFSDAELYTENFYSEDALYGEMLKQMRHVAGYAEYAEDLVKNAQKGEIALFQKNEYIRREQEKEVQDFERLGSLPVSFAPYRGVQLLARLDFADGILVVFLILLVASLIAVEKEEGTLFLLRTTCYGRKHAGAVKYWCGVMLLLAGILGVYALKTTLVLCTYGVDGWDCVIQSVDSYGACRYGLTVGGFLVLSAVSRLAAYVALYSILFFFAVFIRKVIFLYGFCGLFMGLEGLFSVIISEHSWLSILRKINLISFLDSGAVLGGYQNVNLFQHPADYAYVVSFVEICCFIFFMILGIFAFEWKIESGVRFLSGIRKRRGSYQSAYGRSAGGFFPNPIFLFWKECKKVWIGEKGIWLFAAGVFFFSVLYTPIVENFQDKDEVAYHSYMLRVEGKYSDSKLSWLNREKEKLEKIQKQLDAGTQYTDVQRDILQKKAEKYQGLMRAIRNVEYVRDNGWSYLLYEKGYLTMFGGCEGKWELLKIRLIAVLLMVGFAVSVWGIEAWSGMDQVLCISAAGKRYLKRMKCLHILLLAVIICSISILPWIYRVMQTYGCGYWDAPLGSMAVYQDCYFRAMPIGAAIVGFCILHLLYLYLAGRLVDLIRNKMESYILTGMVSFVLFCLPVFLLGF